MNRSNLIMQPGKTIREILGNNRRAAYVGFLVLVVLGFLGKLPNVSIPTWWPAVAVAAGAMWFGGRKSAERILDLIPEEEGIYIVEFDNTELGGGGLYEISEESFENMRVIGDLHAWDESPKRAYEVADYNLSRNVAVANWRESKPGSALAAETTVDDVVASINELREQFEEDAAEGKEIKRSIRGIVRQLDKDRAEAQEKILDDHVSPDLGSSRTITEVIQENLRDELHPNDIDPMEVDSEDSEGSPVATDAAGSRAVATDGSGEGDENGR